MSIDDIEENSNHFTYTLLDADRRPYQSKTKWEAIAEIKFMVA